MKNIIFIIFFAFNISNVYARSGSSGVGNGGDPIRDAFIMVGKNIITNYQNGLMSIQDKLMESGTSNINQLNRFLTIDVIQTSDITLYDNLGSAVSSLGAPNSITLYVGNDLPGLSWNTLLLDKLKSERLVLHEILRAAAINDDNYVYTNIVLRNQGRINDPKFSFIWAKKNDILITSTLSSSFSTKNAKVELSILKNAGQSIMENNNLAFSEMVKTYMSLTIDIDDRSNINEQKTLQSYRGSFRELKNINTLVDQFSKANLDYESNAMTLLNQYFVASLRQIQSRFFDLAQIDKEVLKNYVDSLILISTSSQYTMGNRILVTKALYDLEAEISSGISNANLMKKVQQTVSIIGSN